MSQSNTLEHYQTLSQQSEALGCKLPKLNTGHITLTTSQCKQQELANQLAPWLKATGWYQAASSTGLGMPEQLNDLLEGQWHLGNNSLHLSLLQGNNYQLVAIKQDEQPKTDAPAQCYSEQHLWLRSQLKGQYNALRYRFWWQELNGAWQPLMQQFTGFDLLEEK